METLAIHYTPSAYVTFTRADVEFMLVCAETHYDAECREAGKGMVPHDGNRPGFLRGISNCIATVGEHYQHRLTFRQIDTLAKIIEVPPPRAKVPMKLAGELHAALCALNENAIEDKQLPP